MTLIYKSLGDSPGELTNMALTNVELLRLGRRIRASRKRLGRKQKEFCARCGLERNFVDGVERGERNLSFSNLCQICEGLECDIAAVTEGIPHPEKDIPRADRGRIAKRASTAPAKHNER
jgi:transcriptional regulator with XRE-family HTH domain